MCYSLFIVKIRIKTTIPSKNMVDPKLVDKKPKLVFIAVHKYKEKYKISLPSC